MHFQLNDLLSEFRIFFEKLIYADVGLLWVRRYWMRWQWWFIDACGLCLVKGRLFFEMRIRRSWSLYVFLTVSIRFSLFASHIYLIIIMNGKTSSFLNKRCSFLQLFIQIDIKLKRIMKIYGYTYDKCPVIMKLRKEAIKSIRLLLDWMKCTSKYEFLHQIFKWSAQSNK